MFFLKKKQARRRRRILMLFVTKGEGKQCFFVLEKQKNPPPQCAFECGFCLNWLNVKQKIGYFASRIYLCVSEFSKKSRTLIEYFLDRSKNPSNEKTLNELWECRFLEVTSIGTWHDFVWTHRIHFISVNYQLSKISSSSIWVQTWLPKKRKYSAEKSEK